VQPPPPGSPSSVSTCGGKRGIHKFLRLPQDVAQLVFSAETLRSNLLDARGAQLYPHFWHTLPSSTIKRAIAPTAARDATILRLLDSQEIGEVTGQSKGGAMRTVAQSRQVVKEWAQGGSRSVAMWLEWQEMKFILVSVGLPVLLVALVVQLVPHLLQF
jgi:hypothetical protein